MGALKQWQVECMENDMNPYDYRYNINYINHKTKTNDNYTDKEEYVKVKFSDYNKEYTYIAPYGQTLTIGEKIEILSNGEVKIVTVTKGNYTCSKKKDMDYKRIHIL